MAAIGEIVESWAARFELGGWGTDEIVSRWAFRWSQRESFYEYLSSQLDNEVTLRGAIERYRKELLKRKKLRAASIVGSIGRRIENGARLSSAVARWAPAEERLAIASGEFSGNLAAELDRLLDSKSSRGKIGRVLFSALIPPFAYLAATYGVLIYIGGSFVPMMIKDDPHASYSGLGAVTVMLGRFATSPLAIVPPLVVAGLVIAVMRSMERWTGPIRRRAERFFPWSYYRDVQGYVWLSGFTAMMQAGMADRKILAEQAAHASPWLRERLNAIQRRVENGQAFGEALAATGFNFPDAQLVDSIVAMSGFADFPERMEKRLARWLGKFEGRMTIKAEIMGYLAEIVMLVLIAFIVMGLSSLGKSMAGLHGAY